MTLIERTIKNTLLNASLTFPIVLVTGPRQVGKTTLLETCAEKNRNYVTPDDHEKRLISSK